MSEALEVKLVDVKADAAAEKAYAAASEQVEVKAVKAEAPKPVKAKPAPVAKAPAEKKAAPVVQKAAAPKKPVQKKTVKAAAKKAPKTITTKPATVSQIKETVMTKTKAVTEDFAARVKETVAEAQERAKAAYDKGAELFGDANEFNKGNLEALVESAKILAAGLQDLGKTYANEGKGAFETVTADVKELAAVKSPADFFKLQGEILRRNFDAAVASGSKNSESAVKLVNEAFAPISTRVSLAIEKVKQAA